VEVDDAIGHLRDGGVVRHQQDRGTERPRRAAQRTQHGTAGLEIERAGRLVEQQHGGALDERTSDRHALLLAARQQAREAVGLVGQSDLLERVGRVLLACPDELTHERHVLLRGERGDEVEELEDETHFGAAVLGQGRLVETAHLGSVDHDHPGSGRLDTADDVHQRGLARTARTEHHHELPSLDLERGVLEGVDGQVALTERLVDVVEADDRLDRRHRLWVLGGAGCGGHRRSSGTGLSSCVMVVAAACESVEGSAMRWMR